MSQTKRLEQEINQLTTLNSLTKVYGQVASLKIKATKSEVLETRNFLAELSELYRVIIQSYRKEVQKLHKDSKGDKITLLTHNGRQVAVFLSSNAGLFGDILEKSFNLLASKTSSKDVEIAIVGKTGKHLFEAQFPGKPYTYFDISDTHITQSQISAIVSHIVQYEKISVYFGVFKNVIEQEATVLSLSAESFIPDESEAEKYKESYIFEPDIKSVLQFFETEIFASLFDQTVREHELAKSASRILAMNKTQNSIEKALKELNTKVLHAKHKSSNKKQQDRLASSTLWKI